MKPAGRNVVLLALIALCFALVTSLAVIGASSDEWRLTDRAGSTVIKDDDDIVIHVPSGVSTDDIEKIYWYRNGFDLKFVDPYDKVLVLTNEQMKTFTGDSREHSPASSHTDHAIAGYEYQANVYLADGTIERLKTTIESTFKWRPEEVWAQINQTWLDSMQRLSSDEMVAYFEMLKDDGFTGISLDMPYYMMTPYDNNVFELKTADPQIAIWGIRTPTLDELETMLKAISEAGLEIQVRGYIYISQEYQDEHGFAWSALIDPRDPEEFFDNYTRLWLKLVLLLNKYHVKLITPFTEMDGIEKYPELIKRMYSTISRTYEGEMGFEEATNLLLTGNSVINETPIHTESAFRQLVKDFTFWDWKDSHGRPMRLEYSCWTPPLETQKDQRVSVMAPNFVKFWEYAVNYYSSTYPQDPQMFGEIGVYDADGVGLGPTYWNMTNKVLDYQEVADVWCAYLNGTRKLGIESLNIWIIPFGDFWSDGVGDTYLNIGLRKPESPAYRVIKAIIAPEEE